MDPPSAQAVPDPKRPQDLRLRKRAVALGFAIGWGLNVATSGLVFAFLATAGSVLPGGVGVPLWAVATLAVNVGSIVVCVRRRRREWALGIALLAAVFVVGFAALLTWASTWSWC